ncbi:hypothetical protein D3C78_1688100 [compost metagenome]
MSVYETKFLQSPFNFYYQVFSVPTNENLHDNWVNTFYDLDDAQKAAEMLRMAIRSVKGIGRQPKTITHYIMTLEKMIAFLSK